ncbi:oxidoreductase, short chain dehydrogenase/reductase family [Aspergillus novofumigatus IBT 16806]|uniref:Oxidoreductase n=1 Tax=Aspergillus novofumigatus (strain IBT 16806) TaxID=1392255 RepID=A0A2I1C0C0_ASPN1|nr:oxidoreductase [Aspergillus novofumigatus IBT 16806]PKX91067.1 oxidoreductase [Aspergillus novofumigatus IBT 16806]
MTTPTPNLVSINKLSGTRVLIIGGTSGLGFAVARAALEHGASVLVASSRPEKVQSALSRLRTFYPDEQFTSRIAGTTVDLGDESTLEANVLTLLDKATQPDLFPSTADTSGKSEKVLLDHIVFTAGDALKILPPTDPTLDPAYIRALTTVRVLGGLMLAKHVPSYMAQSARSSLTLTSGAVAVRPPPGYSVGAMLGNAIIGLGRGLAVDLAPVRVNVVAPGAVRTELFGGLPEEVIEGLKGRTLTGNWAGRRMWRRGIWGYEGWVCDRGGGAVGWGMSIKA